MKHFIVYSEAGEILRAGRCPDSAFDLQAQAGEFLLEGKADVAQDAVDVQELTVIVGGRVNPISDALPSETYVAIRKRLYPSVEQQMDMLWHSMNRDEIPKAEPFFTVLKAVKDAVPKIGTEIFDVEGG